MLCSMHLVIISGLSGSGKSIALNLLEDAAYYCVDNLPVQLLPQLVDELARQGARRSPWRSTVVAARASRCCRPLLAALRANGLELQFLFLDAKTETLLKRYSETRRRHPLSSEQRTVTEAIAEERVRLESLAELGHHIDTSDLKPNALREWIRQFVTRDAAPGLTLIFESFGFKHGVPLDAELVLTCAACPTRSTSPVCAH